MQGAMLVIPVRECIVGHFCSRLVGDILFRLTWIKPIKVRVSRNCRPYTSTTSCDISTLLLKSAPTVGPTGRYP
jgi:hypothetical protein